MPRAPASFVIALLAGVVLSACDEDPATATVPPRVQPQSQAELDFVRSTLSSIQPASISEDREYCGYIGVKNDGSFVATGPYRGRSRNCSAPWPGRDVALIASYHSHGAFVPDLDSEVPSYDDIRTDILEAVDGYVVTPGGRIWYIDAERKWAQLVCGPQCVVYDTGYQPGYNDPLQTRYTLGQLRARSGQ